MVYISRFTDFKNINAMFSREHDRILKKYNIDFISLKGIKIPLISLYKTVLILFENNSIRFKISDIILLTLLSIGFLGKEDKDTIKRLTISM